ncbi:MAG: tetratricopeptide repeat protein [Phycisphaerae bacterium]
MPPDARLAQDLERKGQLAEAIDVYRRVLPRLRTGWQRSEIQAKLDRLIPQAVSQTLEAAESQRGTGAILAPLDSAIAVLAQSVRFDDEAQRISTRLAQYRKERDALVVRRAELLNRAENEALEKRWRAAVASLRQARAIHADSDVKEQLARTIGRRDDYYKDTINRACGADDWRAATALLDGFREEDPRPDRSLLTSLTTRVGEMRDRVVCRDVLAHCERKQYFTAYAKLIESGASQCADLLERLRSEGSRYYLERGRQHASANRPFRAYIDAVKAKTLDSDDDEIFALHRELQDEVEASTLIRIGVAAFSSPAHEPDAGMEFSDALISELTHNPYGITIIERAKIDEALKQRGKGEMQETVKILGIHFAIVGSVSSLNVEKYRSEQVISKTVQVGVKRVPNPAYEEFRRQYGPNTSKWPSVPPTTLEEPQFEMAKYNKGHARMEGVMTVSIRMFTTDVGAITDSKTFTRDVVREDEFQDGILDAGIKADPEELPTELSMKRSLRKDVVQEAAEWVLNKFNCRQGRYCAEAERRLARRELQAAIKPLAQGYLYCLLADVPHDDIWAKKIRQLALFDLTEPQ